MSTNLVKYDDTNDEFTAYCNDDGTDTEIGPVKWDDANNKFELNCTGSDFQVKYDDSGDKFEAQNVSDSCCSVWPCDDLGPTSSDIRVEFSDINDCAGKINP